MFLWIGFLVCTSAIVYSGIRLSHYDDVIAEKAGLGRTCIILVYALNMLVLYSMR